MTIHPKRNTTTTFGNTSFRKYKKRKDKNKKMGREYKIKRKGKI